MAEEKKKIDLKARLGKGGAGAAGNAAGAATPAPAAVGGATPAPAAAAAAATPPVGASGPGLPVPPGVPVGAPALDPSNPLAAAVAQPRAASAAPQRIEVDEMAVQEAASRARRTGMVFAAIALVAGAGVGFVGGQAKEAGDGRTQARNDAKDLKVAVDGARAKIDDMNKKLQDGVDKLQGKAGGKKEFPKDLSDQLGGVTPAFDGGLLAGRRFSGFPKETSQRLFDFVTNVGALNTHKDAVRTLLTKLKDPVTAQLTAAAAGQHSIQYVVLLGGTSGKDQGGNYVGNLASLSPAFTFTGDSPNLPSDLKATFGGQAVGVPKYKGGAIADPAAIYITPGSFDGVCPSDTKSAIAQLAIKLGDMINEINGEKPPEGVVMDVKKGLLEQADDLSKGLDAVTNAK